MLSRYAETHYTFGLPWSPLFRRMPEMFVDAPHQLLPGKPLQVWLLVKDADRFPVRVRAVRLQLADATGRTGTVDFAPAADGPDDGGRCATNLRHFTIPVPVDGFRGLLRIDATITVDDVRGRTQAFLNHNLPGLAPLPLEVNLLESPLPSPAGWRAGEMHCHSEFTSSHVEFGAPLRLLQDTADAVGLDFVLCTDHSYDLAFRRDRYLEPVDAAANFAEYQAQARALNAARPHLPVIVPGEEISCGNARGQNVHLLAFGHPDFIPGNGDGARQGLRTRPDLAIGEVLERLGDTPSFAAHPAGHRSRVQRLLLNRGPWRDEDLRPSPTGRRVTGLQFWNGSLDREYHDGKEMWIRALLRGTFFLPIGANDAHGDFNIARGVKVPLLSLRQGRGHVFGRVRTLVPAEVRNADGLRAAFTQAGRHPTGASGCTCTDGPFAQLFQEGSRWRVLALSSGDFGMLRAVTVWGARPGDTTERRLSTHDFRGEDGPLSLDERIDLPAGLAYARLEVLTQKGRRALTQAVGNHAR